MIEHCAKRIIDIMFVAGTFFSSILLVSSEIERSKLVTQCFAVTKCTRRLWRIAAPIYQLLGFFVFVF